MRVQTAATIESLRELDSPTVSNAIERFQVRPRIEGFAGFHLRCAFPELGTLIGYAVTCTADSMTEEQTAPRGLFPLWEAIDAAPKPAVLVIQDVGPQRDRSCHLGEVMATTARALGAVGCVCDGGLRDVLEIKQLGGFQLFSPGFVVSHGNPVILDVGVEVEVEGLRIQPGDLLHGDINGLLVIPEQIAEQIPAEAAKVREEEKRTLELVRSPNFSLQSLREFQEKFRH